LNPARALAELSSQARFPAAWVPALHPIQNVKDHATWFDFSEQSKAYCYYNNEL